MNNSFSLQQISRTGNVDVKLLSRQNKLILMSDFMRLNYENSKLKKSAIANQLVYSSSILQRYKNDIKVLSQYRIHTNNTNRRRKKTSNTKFNNNSRCEHDLKRLQMTSNVLEMTSKNVNESGKI